MRAAIRNAVLFFMIAFLFQINTYASDTITINLTNTYIENEQNIIERPIKFTPIEDHTPDKIINIPADFTQPEDEETKKIGEITALYNGSKFKIDGEEYNKMPDRIGSGYLKSNTNNIDHSQADFQKMGDEFNIIIILIWIISVIGLSIFSFKKFKNHRKRGTKL